MTTVNVPRVEPALLDAFEEQMGEDGFRAVLEYARRRVALLEVAGVPVAADEATTLAQDAITDTLNGVARWDPSAVPLVTHVQSVIRRTAWSRMATGVLLDSTDGIVFGARHHAITRREIFDLLDFTRVRLELAWRDARDQARVARAARMAARAPTIRAR